MKTHCFIIPYDLAGENITIKDRAALRQIDSVLKLHPGEKIIVGDGRTEQITMELHSVGRAGIEGVVMAHEALPVVARQVTLACAALKHANFELVVQKATEIGVLEIIPLITERTIKTDINLERLHKIAREAAEQSAGMRLPVITAPMKLSDLFLRSGKEIKMFCDASGQEWPKINKDAVDKAVVFVGPEGGWTESELSQARAAGVQIVKIGTNILRAETAAIVASFLAVNFH